MFSTIPRGVGVTLALSICLSAFALSVSATSTPRSDAWTLSGRVTDPGGRPIAQAIVRIVELQRTATSDDSGKYSITQIPPGRYTISIRVIGYAPLLRKVSVGAADATLDVTLKPSVIELPAIQVSASAEATSALNSPQPIAVVAEEDVAKVRPPVSGKRSKRPPACATTAAGQPPGNPSSVGSRITACWSWTMGSAWSTTSGVTITSRVWSRRPRLGSKSSAVPQACCTDRMRSAV